MDRPEPVRTVIHFPADVRDWVTTKAARDDRTITATVVRTLRAAMLQEQQTEKASGRPAVM